MKIGLSILLLLSLGVSSALQAHIDMDRVGLHLSRYGSREIKDGPCGRKDGQRGLNVYTYAPGETITVSVAEFVPHPGYFRIAFDNDGDDSFLNPQSIKPIDRQCMKTPEDHCGESDFFNNETVLMDNLDPHKRGFGKTYEWKVKLPDVECDNCTLQVIQIMEDGFPIHAPYNPSYDSDDVYYQCIDLVLKKPVTDVQLLAPAGL